jgi:hypothetical protein
MILTTKGIKGYETKNKNRGTGRGWLHFTLASWGADSSSAIVFSAARLHVIARYFDGCGLLRLAKSVTETGDGLVDGTLRFRER